MATRGWLLVLGIVCVLAGTATILWSAQAPSPYIQSKVWVTVNATDATVLQIATPNGPQVYETKLLQVTVLKADGTTVTRTGPELMAWLATAK